MNEMDKYPLTGMEGQFLLDQYKIWKKPIIITYFCQNIDFKVGISENVSIVATFME